MLHRFTIIVLAAVLASGASAQLGHFPRFVFNGNSAHDVLGSSVSAAGDVNHDGFDDILVGAPGARRVYVYSGFDGSELFTFRGPLYSGFGGSVSGAADVNADGTPDFIIGAPRDSTAGSESGAAWVYSGVNGARLYVFHGDGPLDNFGQDVSAAGDVNADGFDDFVVGSFRHNGGIQSGVARVFSGRDGSVLYNFTSDSVDLFALSSGGAGDVNADGFDDVIVGAPGLFDFDGRTGRAWVYSGMDGSVLYAFSGDSVDDNFGWSVSGAGDVNGDGFDDVIVGAYGDESDVPESGSAHVFSGSDGSVLYTFYGESELERSGSSVCGAGDVNADGFADVIVASPSAQGVEYQVGLVRVYSGFDGAVLYTFYGQSLYAEFGLAISGAGDVNADGFDDLVVGARDDNTDTNSGSAWVFASRLNFTPCPGDSNEDGVVDFADLDAIITAYGQWGPAFPEDVARDGVVNFADLNLVLSNFGAVCPD